MKVEKYNSGIYKIINLISGKYYLGSSCNLKERFRRHKRDLINNKHHSIHLQRAYNKYGEENFDFQILLYCSNVDLIYFEESCLQNLKPLYNSNPHANNSLGYKHTKEALEKLRNYTKLNNIKPPKETYWNKRVAVEMLDKTTQEILHIFDSLSDACRYIGKSKLFVSTLTAVCKGKRQSAFGYKWKFYEGESGEIQ